jgi:lysophospholipase L1-like esterase
MAFTAAALEKITEGLFRYTSDDDATASGYFATAAHVLKKGDTVLLHGSDGGFHSTIGVQSVSQRTPSALGSASVSGMIRTGRTLAIFGDSISAGANNVAANTQRRANAGYGSWIPILTKQRVTFPWDYNFGVNGDTTAMMLARLSQVTAVRPTICVVHGGTNDAAGTGTADAAIANLSTIYDALQRIGTIVIAIPILGRSSPNAWASTARSDVAFRINDWIRRQRFVRRNFYVADCSLVFDDPVSATFGNKGFTADGLHPDPTGSYLIAKQIVTIINGIYPDVVVPYVQQADAWSATNPSGNLLLGATLAGTSGSVTGATGSVATNWLGNAAAAGGATVAFSKVTRADGRLAHRVDVSGNYAATTGTVLLQYSVNAGAPLAGLVAGDIIENMCEYEIFTSHANVSGLSLILQTVEGGVNFFREDAWANNTMNGVTEAHTGLLRTQSITLGAAPTAAYFQLKVAFKNVGAVCRVHFSEHAQSGLSANRCMANPHWGVLHRRKQELSDGGRQPYSPWPDGDHPVR